MTSSNVSFLNSGNLLHTIFPRSQCWCVDGKSIFVLRIRQDAYYRIELPYETDEDKDRISRFTSVLSQVLQYERTQCPFMRAFGSDIHLPERPKSPPRQRIRRQSSQTKVKRWTFDKTWVPEGSVKSESNSRPVTPAFDGSDCGTLSSYDDDDRSSVCTDTSDFVMDSSASVTTRFAPRPTQRRLSVAERASIFQGFRSHSMTAPAKRGRGDSMSSMERIPESPRDGIKSIEAQKPILERHISEAASMVSSADSFYSVETATPPFLDAEADIVNPWGDDGPKSQDELRGRSSHRRQPSEMTVRAALPDNGNEAAPVTPTIPHHPGGETHPSPAPSTPPLVSDSDDDSIPGLDVQTPPNAVRMKRLTGATQRRAFSPMPHPQNLFRTPRPSPSKEFTNALVRTVLGPPAHLVSIMLRIAASISNGFRLSTYRLRRAEKIPCSWDSDDEADWSEDDFGIPLGAVGDPRRRRTFSGELD